MAEPLRPRTTKTVGRGHHYPLGATLTPDGVNFAVYSKHASEVFLLLFAAPDAAPTDVIPLRERTRYVWHAHVDGVHAGQLYGYKVRGEHRPAYGLRFNEAKLLLDPYAKAVTGKFRDVDNLLLGYDPRPGAGDTARDDRDDTLVVPKALVVDDTFDWQGDDPEPCALEKLVLYEVHVKGFTAHPSSGVRFPGTYLGFVEKIPHLVELGVNAVELLPVHEHVVGEFLRERGLTNYWGYDTIGFFAPECSYAARPGAQVAEFKMLVRALHAAGIRVILDVVYNHSGEGNQLGPTLSFRGLDNPSYYCLTGPPDEPRRYYQNYTGTGNSLDFASAPVIRLVMDSLRYWMEHMHVDGFRFDLASVMGRAGQHGEFQAASPFFDAVAQDPLLCRAILIAEPWDLGTYQVGNFPVDWAEWNGRFRDTVRRFGKGDAGQLSELGWRLTGSADLYGEDGRSAYASVNFVTCHDGFTLHDLVSYDRKHNEANGEGNRDGSDEDHSWNCGVEGESADPAVLALRGRLARNHVCQLLFASGTPMLLGGDEFLRTQRGNNNAYCQDNEISWFDWERAERQRDFFEFVRKAIALTRHYPVLQRRKFFLGRDLDDDGVPDLAWLVPEGGSSGWRDPEGRTLCYQLDANEDPAERTGTRLLLIFHAHHESRWIPLPPLAAGRAWYRIVDTNLAPGPDFAAAAGEVRIDPPDHYIASPRSTVVLVGRAIA